MIKPILTAVVVTAALALTGCTDNPAPVPESRPMTTAPALPPPAPPVEPAPVAPAAPVDNCGLDVADMDTQTQIDCGIVPDVVPESAAETSVDLESVCSDAAWRAANGASGDAQCGVGTEVPEYESPGLYDYPTSGETQREWGCEQGYITEGC